MADIFREVDEEVRRDRAIKIWQKYQIPIIVVAVIIVAATAGWRYYLYAGGQKAEAAGRAYEAALQLVAGGKNSDAETAFADIAKTGPSGYALLARLRLAETIALDDPATAVKNYDAIAADSTVPSVMQNIARLRAAMLRIDSADMKEMNDRLLPLTQGAGEFRNSAREFLAIAALKADDFATAGKLLDDIVTDAATPQDMRQRANDLLGLVAGGPPPKSPPPAAQAPAPAPSTAPAATDGSAATAPDATAAPQANPTFSLPGSVGPSFTMPGAAATGAGAGGFALPLSAAPPVTAPPATAPEATAPEATTPEGAPAAAAPSTAPEATSPAATTPSIAPETTAPAATAPSTTPEATSPAATAPSTAPDAAAPAATAPSTVPEAISPAATAPSTAPEATAPSTTPEATAPPAAAAPATDGSATPAQAPAQQ